MEKKKTNLGSEIYGVYYSIERPGISTSLEFHVAAECPDEAIPIAKRVAKREYPDLIDKDSRIFLNEVRLVKDSRGNEYLVYLTENKNEKKKPNLYKICTNAEYYIDKETSEIEKQKRIINEIDNGFDSSVWEGWRMRDNSIYDFYMAFSNPNEIRIATIQILRKKFPWLIKKDTTIYPKIVEAAIGLEKNYFVSLKKR